MQIAIVLLFVIVCVNVAILVYARTATRHREIAVRGALGASRRRIVAQLFVEALMLASVAAAAGIGLLSLALRQVDAALPAIAGPLPFWMTFRLTPEAVVYIVALTLLSAAIVGVAPALKATGRDVNSTLQGLAAGAGSAMQMGRVWTTLIAAQVALTVALLPSAIFYGWNTLRFRTGDAGFGSLEFLRTDLTLDRGAKPPAVEGERAVRSRYAAAQTELERRLRAEPAVGAVTFSLASVGEERAMVVEAEGLPAPIDPVDYNIVEGSKRGHLVRFNRIAIDFFEAFRVPLVVGRALAAADAGPPASETMQGVLVNRAFVETVFGGENPLGRRIRYVGRSREAGEGGVALDRWYEVVGVVPDFPIRRTLVISRVYHAAAPGDVYPAVLNVRVRTAAPATFAGRLREISAAVDPNLQLRDITTAEIHMKREQGVMRLIGLTITLVITSVVALSAAGIYALMSFTVARRRREIGIRAALGADRNRLLAGIFSRALGQLAIGATVGMLLAVGLEEILEGGLLEGQGRVILPLVAVLMTIVGLLAAIGPARRGLRIQPTEALREE